MDQATHVEALRRQLNDDEAAIQQGIFDKEKGQEVSLDDSQPLC